MALLETLQDLTSDDVTSVTDAARKLGLLLERARFRRRGQGSLGETEVMLGDLVDVELTSGQYHETVTALLGHVERRGLGANPTVVWALGKAHDTSCLVSIEHLADATMTDPERADLLYQAVSVLATVAPEEHRAVLLRAATEAVGEARDLAQQLIDTHSWE